MEKLMDVTEEHQCFIPGCDGQWKSGSDGRYACEDHEDILFERHPLRQLRGRC